MDINIRLLIADIDGTLVTQEKVLTRRSIEAVKRLRDAGVAFTITSGRPPLGMKMLMDQLHLTGPAAAFNGGVFVYPDLSVMTQNCMAKQDVIKVIAAITRHGLDCWLYTDRDWLVREADGAHVEHEAWTVKFSPKVVRDFDSHMERMAKIVGVSDDLAAVARCEADVQMDCGNRVSAARSQPYYLDVTHPDANKGYVVTVLSQALSIPPSEIATIGDMPNDVLMFRKSGVSIAMGNASSEVQRQARFVTASYNDEGFAKAAERYVLGAEAAAGR
jgi:Cof subfamily protein (haloacid dehalogenase superfamily)